jgi:hypothetical protein
MFKMNKTAIFFIFAAVVAIASCKKSDNNNSVTKPSAVTYSYSFTDQFNDDTNGWVKLGPTNNTTIVVSNGLLNFMYHPVYNVSATFTDTVNPAFDTQHDFMLQTSVGSDNAMGLAFGTTPTNGGYTFEINNNGYYALFFQGDTTRAKTAIFNWTKTTAAKPGTYNTLELDQINGEWSGYVNGTQVFTTTARPLAASTLGFIAEPNTNGTADYITVKWN